MKKYSKKNGYQLFSIRIPDTFLYGMLILLCLLLIGGLLAALTYREEGMLGKVRKEEKKNEKKEKQEEEKERQKREEEKKRKQEEKEEGNIGTQPKGNECIMERRKDVRE